MREDGFPEIWMPSSEQRDLRTLLRDRHQWVKIRTRVQNTLQAMALKPQGITIMPHPFPFLQSRVGTSPRAGLADQRINIPTTCRNHSPF
jgi:hypothetical protein